MDTASDWNASGGAVNAANGTNSVTLTPPGGQSVFPAASILEGKSIGATAANRA
jgi:hypothetical protein